MRERESEVGEERGVGGGGGGGKGRGSERRRRGRREIRERRDV